MTEESHLSDREKEILRLVAAGMTNREIAQRLTISPNTVKVHLSNIFEKLGVMSRTEATLYAIEHRIVDVPGGEIVAAQPPGLGPFLRQFTWVWVALGLLLVTFLVTLGANVFVPAPSPEPIVNADIAERWQELAPMPEPRAGMAAVAYDGNIYTIAGEGPEGVSGSVFRYLTAEDRWETLSDKPTPVTDVEGVVIGEKVYIPGGMTASGEPTAILEIYDPRRDTWETGAPLPYPISAYALADFEGKLYLFGGWDGEKALDAVWIYEPGGDIWQAGAQLAKAAYQSCSVESGGKIFILGGRNQHETISAFTVFFPSREGFLGEDWDSQVPFNDGWSCVGAQGIGDIVFFLIKVNNPNEKLLLVQYLQDDNQWLFSSELIIESQEQQIKMVTLRNHIYIIVNQLADDTFKNTLLGYQAIYINLFPNIEY